VVIQECESFHNRTQSEDGGGFDIDGGCIECVLQYNYSHENDGPGFTVCTYPEAPHIDRANVVRWNVSENDSGGISIGTSGRGMTDLQIYHNTAVMTHPGARGGSVVGVWGRGVDARFWNNLFVALDGVRLLGVPEGNPNTLFQGNAYCGDDATLVRIRKNMTAWRASGQEMLDGEPVGRALNLPLDLSAPRGPPGDLSRLKTPNAFRPSKGSEVATTGLDLRAHFQVDPGSRDFSGAVHDGTGNFPIGALYPAP
jgi:hypothetical protein